MNEIKMSSSVNRGTLIVIDGIDGTGKHTQAKLLYNTLINKYNLIPEKDIAMVSFPRYGKPSCTMVEKYLNGWFCADPNEIDPYTASLFYMTDQSISFTSEPWGEVYRNGGIIIADRYYTSNIIHQGVKISNPCKNTLYIKWLIDTSLNRIGLPSPDSIFWLITDKTQNEKMLHSREVNNTTHITDIHESNTDYLDKCRYMIKSYMSMITDNDARQFVYKELYTNNRAPTIEAFINCNDSNNNLRTISSISEEIINVIDSNSIIDIKKSRS